MQNSFIIYKCKTFDTFIQISLKFNCEGHHSPGYKLFIYRNHICTRLCGLQKLRGGQSW